MNETVLKYSIVFLSVFLFLSLSAKILPDEYTQFHKTLTANCYEKFVLSQGDILTLVFDKTKLSKDDKNIIISNLKKLFNINKYRPNDYFEIVYDSKSSSWTHFFYCPSNGINYYSLSKNDDAVLANTKEHQTITSTLKKYGTIQNSLWESMTNAEIPADIILYFADVFAWQIDFLTDVKKGDVFKVIYDIEKTDLHQQKISSQILAAQYKSGSKVYSLFYFNGNDGKTGYFDKDGKSVKGTFLKAPLQFKRISSRFTSKRQHPILKYVRPHLGIDYAAPTGTPVSSVANGIVKRARYTGGYGNLIIVDHLNGYETYYGHLSRYGPGIREGKRISQGQVIGYVGMTGLATGPHLDFRITKNGKFFNFLTIKHFSSVANIPKQELQSFLETANKYLEEMEVMSYP
ncbi:MAG: M23 family metallopeptidase [Elusimicrobiota bacterium]|jgi:murein DD-endopeptidase MepM/ murein hydrolase activator NlpD|nr:M23 family metallopeptidase [Elusimicrobiota bacterium]